ncbi:MAG: beta-1,6-N-acetylglucosaminyltransferase [Symploca sp. SIO3E6]|nr:beta-1,6-N-acetylglucosaminyltransferase [Caldora sp. SIO3E6]
MKIAYIILVHKNPQQLIRLINRLDVEESTFFVHIDKKTNQDIYQEIYEFINKNSNMFLLQRKNIYWGDFSQISPVLLGIKEIFKQDIDFNYVKLLTGQDYPIKSRKEVEYFLLANPNKSFMEYFSIPSKQWQEEGEIDGGMGRIKYLYLRILKNRFKTKIERRFPKGFQPFAGSAYWCLSRECGEYLNGFIDKRKSFINFFKGVNLPDEIFFQTIFMNSPFQKDIINNNLTYTDWSNNAAHPAILCTKDLENLSKSSYLFARKFDACQDSKILDLLDKKIHQ